MRRRLQETVIILAILVLTAMSGYELTAKSPRLLGQPLPGWSRTLQVEHLVRWRQPSRIYPLDKALHEGREAWLYYGLMAGMITRDPFPHSAPTLKSSTAAHPYASTPGHAQGPDKPRTAKRG